MKPEMAMKVASISSQLQRCPGSQLSGILALLDRAFELVNAGLNNIMQQSYVESEVIVRFC